MIMWSTMPYETYLQSSTTNFYIACGTRSVKDNKLDVLEQLPHTKQESIHTTLE